MDSAELGHTIIAAMRDPQMFGSHFRPAESWAPWLVVLKVLFALPLSADEKLLFEHCTGRTQGFAGPLTEAWLLCGRRSGKSRILALIAVCLACFRSYARYLAPGERGLVMVLATDVDQAGVIFGYAQALLRETPMLAPLIERETADTIDLTNGVSIEVHVSSYKSVRGRTLVGALADELAFWRDSDSRDPASAVLAALRPGLSTIPGALLLCASSVYARMGTLYDTHVKHYGRDASPILVWKADTLTMNPSFRRAIIDAARAQDAISAASEYDSQFMSGVSAYVSEEDIEATIVRTRKSLPAVREYVYTAYVDMSGGRHDSAALAIAHLQRDQVVVVDRVETVSAPYDPAPVIQRFADICSVYHLDRVEGDDYSGELIVSAYRARGISYVRTSLNKNELYRAVLPLITMRRLELPDLPVLESELRGLERKPGSRGDVIDHVRGSHDDSVNAALGAALAASKRSWSARSLDGMARGQHLNGTSYDPYDPAEEAVRRARREPQILRDSWGRAVRPEDL